jgi:hypothetical protein
MMPVKGRSTEDWEDMEITAEFKGFEQSFRTTVAGVTMQNRDGTDRQSLLKALRTRERLKLVREPENSHDPHAVAVFRSTGEQLGYVPAGDVRLAYHMDAGGPATATVVMVTGGPGILGRIFKRFGKNYGCVIEVVKGDFPWAEITPYMDRSREIEELIKATRAMEATAPTEAIANYRKAIDAIVAFDAAGPVAPFWRRARYPIDRLSLILEKSGDLAGSLAEILRYEQFKDRYGLTADAERSISSRKLRLAKKLGARKPSS